MTPNRSLPLLAAVFASLVTGCNKQAPESAPVHAADTSIATREEPKPDASAVEATPALTAPTDAGAKAAAAIVDAATDAAPAKDVRVKVVSIGMHVGGGPFDEPTKQPFLRSVEPHYPELAKCFQHVTRPKQGDVGVDLVVEAAGGRAKVGNPRSTLSGDGFIPCVVSFFEKIDFEKSPLGRKVVSYSVRFIPR